MKLLIQKNKKKSSPVFVKLLVVSLLMVITWV